LISIDFTKTLTISPQNNRTGSSNALSALANRFRG
jgi:hypothetical protein